MTVRVSGSTRPTPAALWQSLSDTGLQAPGSRPPNCLPGQLMGSGGLPLILCITFCRLGLTTDHLGHLLVLPRCLLNLWAESAAQNEPSRRLRGSSLGSQ